MRALAVVVLVGGCGKEDPDTADTGDGHQGACGDVSSIPALAITGKVRDVDQNWLEGVEITLEERNWAPKTHGTATSGPGGVFTVSGTNLPVVEDCWGTAVQFWVTGAADGLAGDLPVNPSVEEAYTSGASEVTVEVPMILYPESDSGP